MRALSELCKDVPEGSTDDAVVATVRDLRLCALYIYLSLSLPLPLPPLPFPYNPFPLLLGAGCVW